MLTHVQDVEVRSPKLCALDLLNCARLGSLRTDFPLSSKVLLALKGLLIRSVAKEGGEPGLREALLLAMKHPRYGFKCSTACHDDCLAALQVKGLRLCICGCASLTPENAPVVQGQKTRKFCGCSRA